MLDIYTIKTLSLVREIRQPSSESEKFHNSDKSWQDANLGKNPYSINAAFFAIQKASKAQEKSAS